MSRYGADDVYCIPGTAVLKNKAGTTDPDLLDEFEAHFTAIRILELAQNPIEGKFDLAHLCAIHAHLFQDVYDWAGEVRSVDIIRGDSRFCNVRQIQPYSNSVFNALKRGLFRPGLLCTGLVCPVVGVGLQAVFLPLLAALFLALGFGAIGLFWHLWGRGKQVIAVGAAKFGHGCSPVS